MRKYDMNQAHKGRVEWFSLWQQYGAQSTGTQREKGQRLRFISVSFVKEFYGIITIVVTGEKIFFIQ
jgi:hypothetical protein